MFLESLPTLDPLTSSESGYYEKGNWSKPSWAGETPSGASSGFFFPVFGTQGGAYWSHQEFFGNQAISFTRSLGADISGRYWSLWLCLNPTTHSGYRAQFIEQTTTSECKVKIFKVSSGMETLLGESAAFNLAAKDQFALWKVGGSIQAWIRHGGTGSWVKITEFTDATPFAGGYVGVDGSGSDPFFTNFQGGEELVLLLGTTATSTSAAHEAVNGEIEGYQFEAQHNGTLEEVRMNPNRAQGGSPGTSLVVGIYADSGGNTPTGAPLGEATYNAAVINGIMTASGLSVLLHKGTKYWLVFMPKGGNILTNTGATTLHAFSTTTGHTKLESVTWTAPASTGPATISGYGKTLQTVETLPESEVTTVSAQLNGISNPEGVATEVFFEYGLTNAYGSSTAPVAIGSGSSPVAFFAGISKLEPNIIYHFRAVATSASGTVVGVDETLQTRFKESPIIYPTIIKALVPAVDWRWYLANSRNLELLGELDAAQSRKIQLALNGSEQASFMINTLEPVAELINPLSTALAAYRNGKLVWTGPVWTISEGLPENSVNVSCIGWFELFNHRLLKCGPNAPPTMPTTTALAQTYANVDQTAIMAELILRTIADSPFLNPNIRVGQVPSTVFNGGSRNITYQQFQNIGQAITTMANVENGFDFRVDPVTLAFNMYYELIAPDIPGATLRGRGKHRPNTVFGYKWGPENLAKIARTIDGSKVINDAYALGQYGLGYQGEARSIEQYGKLTAETSLSGVVSSTILAAYAAAQVIVYAQPQTIYTFDVLPYHSLQDVPQPFEDFDIGDMVHLGAQYGRFEVPILGSSTTAFPVRMFSFEVEISNDGVEQTKNVQTVYTTSA